MSNFGSVPDDQARSSNAVAHDRRGTTLDRRCGDVQCFSDKIASRIRFRSTGSEARYQASSVEVEMCDLFATRNYLKLLKMAK